jgi:hypothetical protein
MRNLNAAFYANNVYYRNLPFEVFCEHDVVFRAEIRGLSVEPGSLKWYVDGIEETAAQDKWEWTKNFPIGEYEIEMWVRFFDDDTMTLESTLNIGVLVETVASPPEGGSVAGGGCYKAGEQVTVIATPNTCYHFVNWTENGAEVSTDASHTFIATKDRTLTANFGRVSYSVKVETNSSDYGYTTGTGVYGVCFEVQIEAFVNSCYRFANWTIDDVVISEENPYIHTVTDNITIVANFYALDFDTYAPVLWNNTFMLNMKKLEEDGYIVTGCKWFKNGEEEDVRTINEFSYSAGENAKDLLELKTPYMFRLETDNYGDLCSTIKIIADYNFSAYNNLTIYPNPVTSGVPFTVDGVIEGDLVQIYNQYGICVSSDIATGNSITFTLHIQPGIYLIRTDDKQGKIAVVK